VKEEIEMLIEVKKVLIEETEETEVVLEETAIDHTLQVEIEISNKKRLNKSLLKSKKL